MEESARKFLNTENFTFKIMFLMQIFKKIGHSAGCHDVLIISLPKGDVRDNPHELKPSAYV